jgi:hypothetical protein
MTMSNTKKNVDVTLIRAQVRGIGGDKNRLIVRINCNRGRGCTIANTITTVQE